MDLNTTRTLAIDNALKAYKDAGDTRTESIIYKGQLRSFEVVRVSLDVPYFNPTNSRLRAQLATHPQAGLVRSDPYASEAQAVIASLLEATDKFDELKAELKSYGQLHPGIISRQGMLVNGNTRLAALRAIGAPGIDVAVLPVDATDSDFFEIEMSLQLVKLVHQDYTFTNRLLLVDSLLARNANEDAAIKAMQWTRQGKQKLQQHQRLLALVEEVRDLASGNLSYSFFDGKEEMFKDLDRDYQAALVSSPSEAENLKWSRITAMLMKLNKDEVRAIDVDFVDEVLAPRASEKVLDLLGKYEKPKSVGDFDELFEAAESTAPGFDLRKLAGDVLSTTVEASGGISDAKLDQYQLFGGELKRSARSVIEDEVARKIRTEPIVYLKEVTQKIEELADKLPELYADDSFDKSKFEFQAKKTQKALIALQNELSRQMGD